jgi:hypothetical protein
VASVGERPSILSRLEQLRRVLGVEQDVIDHIERRVTHPDQAHRYFAVGFRDGKFGSFFRRTATRCATRSRSPPLSSGASKHGLRT